MRLLLWYIAAVYLFGPLLAAPFTGGGSLFFYILSFMIFDFASWNTFVEACWFWLGWFGIALLCWTIHQFIRMTIRHNLRKLRAEALFQQVWH